MSGDKVSMIEAFRLALEDAMAEDEKVIVLGEDIADREGGGVMGQTRGLSERFGTNRVRSTPISEQAIMGAAIGAALAGFRPVAEIMLMNFTTVAMDMIVNHAAKLRYMSGGKLQVPLVIRTMTGSGFALAGQHSDYLESWFAHTAGIKVVAPSNATDAYSLLRAAIADPDPVLYIENVPLGATKAEIDRSRIVPIGKGLIVNAGDDVTIVAHSRTLIEAIAAVKQLKQDGVSAELIDLRSIKPWDRELVLSSVRKTGRLLVAHEAVKEFGIGAEIVADVTENAFRSLKAAPTRLGSPSAPVPFSQGLEPYFAPGAAAIATSVKALLG
jgi:pyruvate dehydrogenase E1 component beta subunit